MNTQECSITAQNEFQAQEKKNSTKKEKRAQYNRDYLQRNKEKLNQYQREYYHRNQRSRERKLARQRIYELENKEKISERKKEYKIKNIEKFKERSEKNRYYECSRTLNIYCHKAIDKVQSICPDAVNEYYKRYPFDEYAEFPIKKQLKKYGVFSSQARYSDCYDACMMAYLYSIHRCAYLGANHVSAYINKMIRIYAICALVIYDDAKNLCKENKFRDVYIDADYSIDRY